MKYSEIIKLNNSLEGQVQGPKYNISILSNIMVHQSKDVCEWLLRTESLNAKVTLGEYDNIVQDSERFQSADAVVLFWEACNFIDGLQYKIDLSSEKVFNDIVDKVKIEIEIVLSALKQTPVVIINRFSSLIFDQVRLFESPNGLFFGSSEDGTLLALSLSNLGNPFFHFSRFLSGFLHFHGSLHGLSLHSHHFTSHLEFFVW